MVGAEEPKFGVFGCIRRQFVRRRAGERYNNECLQATVHGGGSSQVWGCSCNWREIDAVLKGKGGHKKTLPFWKVFLVYGIFFSLLQYCVLIIKT